MSGTVAGIASAVVVSVLAARRTRSLASASDATSHWVWGEAAKREDAADVAHTGVGYAIHHGSSIFWALLHERWQASRRPPHALPAAAALAAMAYVVDYHVVPPRLTPGFERHLTKPGMLVVYSTFAVGLAAASIWRRRRAA